VNKQGVFNKFTFAYILAITCMFVCWLFSNNEGYNTAKTMTSWKNETWTLWSRVILILLLGIDTFPLRV